MTPQDEGREFEKELSEEFGLKQVPGSGSVWHSKLDLVGNGTRWSLKYSSKGTWPISMTDIGIALEQCFGPGGDGAIPIWAARVIDHDFIVMRKEDFKSMQAGEKFIDVIETEKPQVAARKARARQPELLRED